MSALAGPLHLVALVLVISGVQKVIDPAPPTQAMRDAGVPLLPRRGTWPGRALGVVEAATGLAVITSPWPAAAVWMAAFYLALAGFVVLLRRRDDTAGCGCFGATSAPPTRLHVVANLLAAAVAVAAALVGMPDIVDVMDEGFGVAVPYGVLVLTGAWLVLVGPSTFASATSPPSHPAGVRPFALTPEAPR